MFKYFNSVRKFSKKKRNWDEERKEYEPCTWQIKKEEALFGSAERERERLMKNMLRHRRKKKKRERDLFPEAACRSAESGFTCSFPATHMQTFDSERNYTTRIASTSYLKPKQNTTNTRSRRTTNIAFHLHFLSAEKAKHYSSFLVCRKEEKKIATISVACK